jgi:hypothetical protein
MLDDTSVHICACYPSISVSMTGFPSICVVVRSGVSQFPRWTKGSDVGIHRLAFRSHLTTTATLTLSPSHILRAFSVSLLQDVMRLQISSETGIEHHYRTVRAKTFPSHSITLLHQKMVGRRNQETLELVLLYDAISTVTCRFYAMSDSYIAGVII